jgi:thiamine biosynthesis lipoprotein
MRDVAAPLMADVLRHFGVSFDALNQLFILTILSYDYSFPAMGTDCLLSLFARDEHQADQAADLVMAEVWRIESKYSRYIEGNTLSDINGAASFGKQIAIDEETAKLFDYAQHAFQLSEGLFDISCGALRRVWNFSADTLPSHSAIERILPLIGLQKIIRSDGHLQFSIPEMELDFGGIGKEYAVDRGADICRETGIQSGLLDFGGDIRILGPRPDEQPWTIGIRNPRATEQSLGNIQLTSGAVATSGDYERYIEVDGRRYCHILNPKTGWPVEGLASVTVMSEQCLLAGTLSTIAMLKGSAGKEWLRNLGVQHCWVDEQLHLGGNLAPSAAQ